MRPLSPTAAELLRRSVHEVPGLYDPPHAALAMEELVQRGCCVVADVTLCNEDTDADFTVEPTALGRLALMAYDAYDAWRSKGVANR